MTRASLVEGGFARVREAAKFLNVAESTIYAWMSQGVLPFTRFGRCRRIPWEALRRYAEENLYGVQDDGSSPEEEL